MASQILGESPADAGDYDFLQIGYANEIKSYSALSGSLLIGGSLIDLIVLCDFLIRDFATGVSIAGTVEIHAGVFAAILVCALLLGAALIRRQPEER